jgi:hypothetical protein
VPDFPFVGKLLDEQRTFKVNGCKDYRIFTISGTFCGQAAYITMGQARIADSAFSPHAAAMPLRSGRRKSCEAVFWRKAAKRPKNGWFGKNRMKGTGGNICVKNSEGCWPSDGFYAC